MNNLDEHILSDYFCRKVADLEKRNKALEEQILTISAELRQARLNKNKC